MKELINRINGNGAPYQFEVPKLVILENYINATALNWIFENCGLNFVKQTCGSYEAEPATALQIATLFCVYNFKTKFYGGSNNILYLKLYHDDF